MPLENVLCKDRPSYMDNVDLMVFKDRGSCGGPPIHTAGSELVDMSTKAEGSHMGPGPCEF